MRLVPLLFCFLCLPATAIAAATAVTLNSNWTGALSVPDNSATGTSNTLTIINTGLTTIESVIVSLQFQGGWNGDLYAYLAHNGELAILLNRPGRSVDNDFGAGSTNLFAIFDDSAVGDVHIALPDTGDAFGMFQPDGRLIDPLQSLDTSPRTKLLAGFNGMDVNGGWTLFIADQGAGETATLTSWSLSIAVVPEPSVATLAGLVSLLALRRRRD